MSELLCRVRQHLWQIWSPGDGIPLLGMCRMVGHGGGTTRSQCWPVGFPRSPRRGDCRKDEGHELLSRRCKPMVGSISGPLQILCCTQCSARGIPLLRCHCLWPPPALQQGRPRISALVSEMIYHSFLCKLQTTFGGLLPSQRRWGWVLREPAAAEAIYLIHKYLCNSSLKKKDI